MAVTYDPARIERDLAERGWLGQDLARVADVSHMTVSRALRGGPLSARMLAKLAHALGYSPRRYLTRSQEAA